ncbi:MAG: hypothetical protein OXU96_00345, partial [Gammaproteobacteria bacterium]|nr:hypothetical protein [Gammaproteobacteria bacterium]
YIRGKVKKKKQKHMFHFSERRILAGARTEVGGRYNDPRTHNPEASFHEKKVENHTFAACPKGYLRAHLNTMSIGCTGWWTQS